MKKAMAILLAAGCLLVCGIVPPVTAAGTGLKFEGESTPFTVTDDTGKTTSENKASKWAWSLNLGGASNVSGQLAYFRLVKKVMGSFAVFA